MKDGKKNSPLPKGKSGTLRSRAEKRLGRKGTETAAGEPSDTRSLIQELEVHQVELELQNQELQQAHQAAETAARKYFDLYELAPIGYATLTEKGEILEINLAGAKLLGQERKFLIHRRFQLFVAREDVSEFNQFIRLVFFSDRPRSCELTLVNNGNYKTKVRLDGICKGSGSGKESACQITFLDISPLKKTERDLQASRSRFLTLIEASPGVVFETDHQGNNTYVSGRWTQWTGMTPEETAGHGWLRAIHPSDVEMAGIHWKEAQASGLFNEYRHRLRFVDGSYRWVVARALPVHDPGGNIVRWVGTLTDVNEIIQAEEALKVREELLALFIEHAPAALAMFDREMRYMQASQRWLSDYGLTSQGLRGLSHYVLFPGTPERWREAHRRCLAGEVIRAEEDPFQREDGSVQWLRWEIRPWRDTTGQVGGIVIFTEDITERKRMESVLCEEEENLRGILDSVNESIFLFNERGEILLGNATGFERLNLRPEEGLGRAVYEFLPSEVVRNRMEKLREVFESGQPLDFEDERDDHYYHHYIYPVFNRSGQVRALSTFTREVTETRQVVLALSESEQRYRNLVKNAPVAIYINRSDRVALVNQACLDLFGAISPEQLLGKSIYDLFHPDFHESVRNRIQRIREKLEVVSKVEEQIVRMDGTTRDVEVSSSAFQYQGLPAIHVVLQDITERKQAEEALSKSEQIRRLAQEITKVGTFEWNIVTGVNTWTPELEALYGLPAGGFAGTQQAWEQLVHPTDLAEALATVQRAFETNETVESEWRVSWPDGSIHWLSGRFRVIRNDAGEPQTLTGVNIDITERKQAEEALRESEGRLRLLSETAARLLAEKSPQQAIVDLCTRVMGYLDSQVYFNFLDTGMDGRLHLNAYAGITEEEAEKIKWLDYGKGLCGSAAQEGKKVVAQDISNIPDPWIELFKGFGVQAYACNPLIVGERILGMLSFGTSKRNAFTDSDLDLIKTVADQVALGLERKQLIDTLEEAKADLEIKVEERTAEVQLAWKMLRELTAKLISAEESQKKSTAREIHDTLGSSLSGIKYKIEDMIREIDDNEDPLTVKLGNLIPWIQTAIQDCRRIQSELSPVMLSDLGLLPTIAWFIRRYESVYSTIQVTPILEVQEGDIPDSLKIVIYRLLQEAFNNSAKYSGTDRILLRMIMDRDDLILEVKDYGRGFNPEEVRGVLGESGGLGLSSMRERVEGSGGRFHLVSVIDGGTRISARWPLTNISAG